MWRIIQLVLAMTLLGGGACVLYALLFLANDSEPMALLAAVAAAIAGAGWLYGDFIFPLVRKRKNGQVPHGSGDAT